MTRPDLRRGRPHVFLRPTGAFLAALQARTPEGETISTTARWIITQYLTYADILGECWDRKIMDERGSPTECIIAAVDMLIDEDRNEIASARRRS